MKKENFSDVPARKAYPYAGPNKIENKNRPVRQNRLLYRREGQPKSLRVRPGSQVMRQKLREEKENAIHRSFYGTGGIRFWAEQLSCYAQVYLQTALTPEEIWTDGYNSHVVPMKYRLDLLEEELAELEEKNQHTGAVPFNNDILLCIRRCLSEERLNGIEQYGIDTDVEIYRSRMQQFIREMEREMLQVYPRL